MDGELWDVTDADGVPTGRTHRRGDPGFPEGMFHLVAGVCVVRADGWVLMTRRAETKDWPLCWELPAGSALAGEASRDAAVRELCEETGLVSSVDAVQFVGRVVEDYALFDVFAIRMSGSLELHLDPEEVCEAEWVSVDELRRRCDAGLMAGPWVDRFAVVWDRLAEAVRV